MADVEDNIVAVRVGSDDDVPTAGKAGKKGSSKSRRELPEGAVATLKAWLLSPEHFTHPYPTPQDQVMLMQKTGIDKKQLKNWFTNARRRIWKPMLKKQLEQGKLASTGAGGGGVVAIPSGPGATPGGPAGQVHGISPGQPPTGVSEGYAPPPHSSASDGGVHALHPHYQQALQQQSRPHQLYDAFGNPTSTYSSHQQQPQSGAHPARPSGVRQDQYGHWQGHYGQQSGPGMAQSNSIGSLPPIGSSGGSTGNIAQLNKTDSHAVLMELFARDQDLVRQATEGQRLKAHAAMGGGISADGQDAIAADTTSQQQGGQGMPSQHPMMNSTAMGGGPAGKMGSAPSFNSWPHFSSVSSLNNLGTMTGVKSITNMSGADLVSQGSLNKKGNLAQVKSIESMGRADSYAFLEVFFDDRGSGTGGSSGNNVDSPAAQGPGLVSQQQAQHQQRGIKRDREEENDDIGLSLDGPDDSPAAASSTTATNGSATGGTDGNDASGTTAAPSPHSDGDQGKLEANDHKGNLKRAYDDALAARGLISVRRSCEKLTDLALPAKMQRTLSQEFLRQQMTPTAPTMSGSYAGYTGESDAPLTSAEGGGVLKNELRTTGESEQSAGQPPSQEGRQKKQEGENTALSDPSVNGSSVEVPATTKCSLCGGLNVDTQLRPCGHMFHGRCLKPSLQNAVGAPVCPIDNVPMGSAVLAVPREEVKD